MYQGTTFTQEENSEGGRSGANYFQGQPSPTGPCGPHRPWSFKYLRKGHGERVPQRHNQEALGISTLTRWHLRFSKQKTKQAPEDYNQSHEWWPAVGWPTPAGP